MSLLNFPLDAEAKWDEVVRFDRGGHLECLRFEVDKSDNRMDSEWLQTTGTDTGRIGPPFAQTKPWPQTAIVELLRRARRVYHLAVRPRTAGENDSGLVVQG